MKKFKLCSLLVAALYCVPALSVTPPDRSSNSSSDFVRDLASVFAILLTAKAVFNFALRDYNRVDAMNNYNQVSDRIVSLSREVDLLDKVAQQKIASPKFIAYERTRLADERTSLFKRQDWWAENWDPYQAAKEQEEINKLPWGAKWAVERFKDFWSIA